ncbi:hypothetical protein T08_12375 [Trichinella sp. T8]|nr:hypothetical protein T08_12375 [Trichinella sp. T8]
MKYYLPVGKPTVCLQNLCVLGCELYLHTPSYTYFDYLKPNANQQPGETNQNEVKHTEQKTGKMVKTGFTSDYI